MEFDEYDDLTEEQTSELDSENLGDLLPDLDEETMEALATAVGDRDWRQTELVDLARHPDYDGQRSILVDLETGEAVLDENGEFVDCARNTPGCQRPDGMLVSESDVVIREVKNYSDLANLKQNIKHQTEARYTAFGEGLDLTYVVAPNFTVGEADELCRYVEDELGANLEWQLK